MKVHLKRIEKKYHFEAKGKSGVPVHIDTALDGPSKGASPMELLLMGVGGCSAIDVVNILTKQRQEITAYEMEVSGNRKEYKQAKPFDSIHVAIILKGEIDESKAIRAAKLSFEKYCSVSLSMMNSVEVTYGLVVNGKKMEV